MLERDDNLMIKGLETNKRIRIMQEDPQKSIQCLCDFFETANIFHMHLNACDSQVSQQETWQLRTRAPDGGSRAAIFPSIEGIIVRCTPTSSLCGIVMCNILLPWQAHLRVEGQQLFVDIAEETRIAFLREGKGKMLRR